tara:strand:+ start:482 stop:1294 length:813 start_codon:yes stop_codon:yes gene_type:complete
MATIQLGKIKQVWRGTYNNSTAYTVDDLVAYTDNNITSTYICVANSTGNAPSTGGTAHASWNYVAKGVLDPIPTQTNNAGKVLKTDGSSLSWGTGGGLALISSGTVNSSSTAISIENCFTNTYKFYKLMFSYAAQSWMKFRFIDGSNNSTVSAAGYYFAGSWYRRDAGGSHDVGQFGYFNQNYMTAGYIGDGQANQPQFGEYQFYQPNNSSYKPQFWGSAASKHGNHTKRCDVTGSYDSPFSATGITLFVDNGSYPMTTSNFQYALYGFN